MPPVLIYTTPSASYYRLADGSFNTSPDATGGYGQLAALMGLRNESRQDMLAAQNALAAMEKDSA